MSEALFLVNPRRKRRRKSRKGRMPAGLARYWAARRGGGVKKRRRKKRAVMVNPRRRRRARRRNPVVRSYRRRKARRSVAVYRKRRRNPRVRRRSHRRHRARARMRNPFSTSSIKSAAVPALIGAGGALAMSIGYGYVSSYLPASLQSTWGAVAVKAAVAIGIGFLVGKFMGRADGQAATVGGLTVVAVGAVTPLISSAAPSLPGLSGLRGLNDYVPYRKPGMGAYMRRPGVGRLGFYSPAAVIQQSGRNLATKRPGVGAYMARSVPGMAGFGDLSGGSGFNGLNDGM